MWYREDPLRLAVHAKPLRSMEWCLGDDDDESGPPAKESYPLNTLCPLRHEWTWESGKPECYARLDHWNDEYMDYLQVAVNGDERRGVEWGALIEAAPLRVRKHLDAMNPSLWKSAPQCDSHGGNLMFYAGKKGDTMLCLHLIVKGYGSLAGVEALSGRTAYEVALESGFPDTAFVLEPYAAIRSPDRKWHVDRLLMEELQYVLDQRDAVRAEPARKPNVLMRCLHYVEKKLKGPPRRIPYPAPRPSDVLSDEEEDRSRT